MWVVIDRVETLCLGHESSLVSVSPGFQGRGSSACRLWWRGSGAGAWNSLRIDFLTRLTVTIRCSTRYLLAIGGSKGRCKRSSPRETQPKGKQLAD